MNIAHYVPFRLAIAITTAGLLSFVALGQQAQIKLTANSQNVSPNALTYIEVRAEGTAADSITSIQFSLNWDSTVLKFVALDSYGLPNMTNEDFNLNKVTGGQLAFVWTDVQVTGFPLKNNPLIFRIQYMAIGKSGTKSAIQFSNTPTRVKATNPQILPFTIQTQDGLVNVGTLAVGELQDTHGHLKLYQNIPNPVRQFTNIPFYLNESDTVSLKIFDLTGRELINRKAMYQAGKNEIKITTEGVLTRGTYIYSVSTSKSQLSRTMIVD